jgi:hypothetical protein
MIIISGRVGADRIRVTHSRIRSLVQFRSTPPAMDRLSRSCALAKRLLRDDLDFGPGEARAEKCGHCLSPVSACLQWALLDPPDFHFEWNGQSWIIIQPAPPHLALCPLGMPEARVTASKHPEPMPMGRADVGKRLGWKMGEGEGEVQASIGYCKCRTSGICWSLGLHFSKDTLGTQPAEFPTLSRAYGMGAARASDMSTDSKEQNSTIPKPIHLISSRLDSTRLEERADAPETPVAMVPQTLRTSCP